MGEHQSIGCYHCGLPVDSGSQFTAKVEGQHRQFCCVGCESVALLISGQGLGEFYKRRTANAERAPEAIEDLSVFDNPQLQTEFVSQLDGHQQAELLVQGITCTACVWLVEKILKDQSGVIDVSLHSVTHRLLLTYDADQVKLSSLLATLLSFGYRAQPWRVSTLQQNFATDKRKALKRIGLAGIGMMQVGMIAIATYAGDFQGIDQATRNMLNWVKALMATPVVLYSALPFFQAAYRSLAARHLSMDVPVALAIGLAYLASVWATLTGQGQVYFDAVMMFTFFLLIGRYYEHQSRHRNLLDDWQYRAAIPDLALVQRDNVWVQAPSGTIEQGEMVRVAMGDQLPADGVLVSPKATIDESIFSGESEPISKAVNDPVYAGSGNVGDVIEYCVSASVSQSQLAKTNRAADQAQQNKPKWVAIADRVAAYFVGAVIIVSTLTFAVWYQVDPSRAFWVALSVLVATCPCALSLATPTVLAAAVQSARRKGLLVRNAEVLSLMPDIDEVVFDKTGTLTDGRFTIASFTKFNDEITEQQLKDALVTLEQHSKHPVANVLNAFAQGAQVIEQAEVTTVVGKGVEAVIDDALWRVGRADWAADSVNGAVMQATNNSDDRAGVWLSVNGKAVAQFILKDQLRDEAIGVVNWFKQQGVAVTILSGDVQSSVDEVANTLSVDNARGSQLPNDKRAYLQQRQQQGARVAMVGDGLNDIEVLAQSDVSVVVGDGVDLVVDRGDILIINHRLVQLKDLWYLSTRTKQIEKQNIVWALTYNGSILPAAALGLVAPWAAAIGMSLSSIFVVANALRVKR